MIVLLSYLFILCRCSDNGRHFFAQPPFFRGSLDGLDGWEYGDFSIVSNDWIQLTPNTKSTAGSIWANEPCVLNDWEANFQISVFFSCSSFSFITNSRLDWGWKGYWRTFAFALFSITG